MQCFVLSLLLGIIAPAAFGQASFRPKVVAKAQKAIVTVHTRVSLKAYGIIKEEQKGMGCIVDKAQGLILTNRSIVDPAAMSTYQLKFHDGTQAEAKLCYYDPWVDFAFLKLAPEAIPEDSPVITFSDAGPSMNQSVFMVSHNESKGFAVHTGQVSGLHEIEGTMPQHTFNVSLDTQVEMSGSPIMDVQGRVLALHYGGRATFGLGLHPAYIRYALAALQQGQSPIRKHMGAITTPYSLSRGKRYRGFPEEKLKDYVKQFPTSMGYAIQVARVLPGSPAQGRLQAGDIIWAVNGQGVGPDLVVLDMAMNHTEASQVSLSIWRDGVWLAVVVPLYDLETHTIQRMVNFGGALFFEVDDIFSDKMGVPAGRLTLANAQSENVFGHLLHYGGANGMMHFGLQVLALDEVSMDHLDQLIQHIPQLIAKRYFTVGYVKLIPARTPLSELFGISFSQQDVYKRDIAYDPNAPAPTLYVFDREKMEWRREEIIP